MTAGSPLILSFDLTIIVFFELALDSERLKPDTILRRFAVAAIVAVAVAVVAVAVVMFIAMVVVGFEAVTSARAAVVAVVAVVAVAIARPSYNFISRH